MDDIKLETFYDHHVGSIHRSHPNFINSYFKQIIKFGYKIIDLRCEIEKLKELNEDLRHQLAVAKAKHKEWGVVMRPYSVKGDKTFVIRQIKQFMKQLSRFAERGIDIDQIWVEHCLKHNPSVLNYVTTKMHLDFIKDVNRDLMYMYQDLDFLDSVVMSSVKYHWSRRSWNQFNRGVTLFIVQI